MLILKTGSVKQTISDLDGKKFNVYQVIVCDEKGRNQELQDYGNFVNLRKVEIIAHRGRSVKKLNIDLNTHQSIVDFLNYYHAKQDLSFDCYSFVNMAHEVKQHHKMILEDFWDIKLYQKRLKIGDVVFLVNKKSNYFYHAAIYIGFGLYVSVYGVGGDMEISTLKDMKKDFGAELVLTATPKKIR